MHVLIILTKEGFTLVEILVTIIIIGVLTAIAVPSFQNYIKRAKFANVEIAALNAQKEIEFEFQTGIGLSNINYSSGASRITTSESPYIQSIDVTAGAIKVIGTPEIGSADEIYELQYTPTISEELPENTKQRITWSCSSHESITYLASSNCKGPIVTGGDVEVPTKTCTVCPRGCDPDFPGCGNSCTFWCGSSPADWCNHCANCGNTIPCDSFCGSINCPEGTPIGGGRRK